MNHNKEPLRGLWVDSHAVISDPQMKHHPKRPSAHLADTLTPTLCVHDIGNENT